MSYSERLNDFNTATAQTLDHVQSIKDHLNDPTLRENPVALGLEARKTKKRLPALWTAWSLEAATRTEHMH